MLASPTAPPPAPTGGPPPSLSPARPEPDRRVRTVLLAAVLVLAGALAWFHIDGKSLWFDESVSWFIARMSTHDFVHTVLHDEANMPLYYAVLRGWIALGGDGDTWLRLLSAVFGVATVGSLYALARRLYGFEIAIVASVLLATNAFFVQHTQETRSYMMAALLATLVTFVFVRAVETGRGWWLYAVLLALGVYAHLYVVLVPVAQLVSLAFLPRVPGLVKRFGAALGGAVVLTLPYWWVAVTRGSEQIYANPPLDLRGTADLLSGLAGGAGIVLTVVVGAASVAVAVVAIGTARRSGRGDALWRLGLPLLLVAIPTVGILATTFVDRPPALRYLSFLAPALALVVARGLAVLRDRRLVIGALVVVVALQAVGLRRWYDEPHKEDWRAAVHEIEQRGRPGDAVVLYDADRVMLFRHYDDNTDPATGPTLAFPHADFNPFPLYAHPLVLTEQRLERIAARGGRIWYLVPNDSATDTPPPRAARLATALEATHTVTRHDDFYRVGLTLFSPN